MDIFHRPIFLKESALKLTVACMIDQIHQGYNKAQIIHTFVQHGYSAAATAHMWGRCAVKLKLIVPAKTNR
jgi:hypothetical protein